MTDPPYLYLDHKLDRPFDEQLFFEQAKRVLKSESMLVFFGRGASFYKWGYICSQLGFEFLEEIVWDKKHCSSPFGNLMRVHETVSVWRKGNKQLNKVHIDKLEYDTNSEDFKSIFYNVKRIIDEFKLIKTGDDFEKWKNERKERKTKHNITTAKSIQSVNPHATALKTYQNGKVLSSIVRVNREHYQMEHPTQKPVELLELLIKLTSSQSDIIFDPSLVQEQQQ